MFFMHSNAEYNQDCDDDDDDDDDDDVIICSSIHMFILVLTPSIQRSSLTIRLS